MGSMMLPVRHLAVCFHLRVVPILGWLAAVVRILGVALHRVARAAASVRHLGFRFSAHGAVAHHHRTTPKSRPRLPEVVLSMTTRPKTIRCRWCLPIVTP